MALAAGMVWESRPGAGSDNNGGGFNPAASGTDFSQQNAAQFALVGVTSSGAGNTVLSASAAASMVGNVGQAISGTNINPGFYEVLSVVVGTSITFSTNSAGGSICSGAAAAGVINIGGALGSIQKIFSTGVLAPANPHVWVKGNTTLTVALSISFQSGNSQANNGTVVEGYTTTRGDNGQVTITTATNSIDLVAFTSSYGLMFKNIIFSTTAGTPGDGLKAKTSNNSSIALDNCVVTGFSRGIVGNFAVDFMFAFLLLRNTEIKNCVSHGVINSGMTVYYGSRIHNNGGDGHHQVSGGVNGPFIAINSIFDQNTGNGAGLASSNTTNTALDATGVVINTVFVANGGDGLQRSTAQNEAWVIQNIVSYANSGFGRNDAAASAIVLGGTNGYGANTSGAYGNFASSQPGDVTLTADPFTNRAAGDFSLNTTAGGGALLRSAGFPGVLQTGGTGFLSIGALQPSIAGSNTFVLSQNITQLIQGEP